MIGQILSRLATAVPSLVGVVIVTFMLTRMLPGDPAAYFAGLAATPQAIAEIRSFGDGRNDILPVWMSLELLGDSPRIQRHYA